jgi:hypothetical protein
MAHASEHGLEIIGAANRSQGLPEGNSQTDPGEPKIFSDGQIKAIGMALAEIRRQIRTEQAATTSRFQARVAQLEGRVRVLSGMMKSVITLMPTRQARRPEKRDGARKS